MWRGESAGFPESDALLINVITSLVNVSTTIVALLLMDRIGRPKLLLIGSAGMSVTLLGISGKPTGWPSAVVAPQWLTGGRKWAWSRESSPPILIVVPTVAAKACRPAHGVIF
jgi:hypothetical protein